MQKYDLKFSQPLDIEAESMRLIAEELGDRPLPIETEAIVKRVIHTTADFDYYDSLAFSEGAVKKAIEALKSGVSIFTDTQMALSGINKKALEATDSKAFCFISDQSVAEAAIKANTTRAQAAVDKSLQMPGDKIYAIGNAPTALVRLYELIKDGLITPKLIIAAPVGFVNVVEAKELILGLETPYIVARGRKGGSNVAAAIVNALLYQISRP